MRLVYKKYADGTHKLYQTDEKGRNEHILDSNVPEDAQVRRVPVFIELNCDYDRLGDARNGLDLLRNNLEKAQWEVPDTWQQQPQPKRS